MRKLKLFINLDEEEKWLEKLLNDGWVLNKKKILYHFSKINNNEIKNKKNIKIDFRMFSKEEEFFDYIYLFEDLGWNHIAGHMNSGRQYFLNKDDNISNEIFSTRESKAERYKIMSDFWNTLATTYSPIAIALVIININDIKKILYPNILHQKFGI